MKNVFMHKTTHTCNTLATVHYIPTISISFAYITQEQGTLLDYDIQIY